jgi:hypothetical protein
MGTIEQLKKLFASGLSEAQANTATGHTELPLIRKKVGDPVTITISLKPQTTDLLPFSFVGCKMYYPASLVQPVTPEGSDAVVTKPVDLHVFAGNATDDIVKNIGQAVHISCALKNQNAPVVTGGDLVAMSFVCLAKGSGEITLTDLEVGKLSDGQLVNYTTESDSPWLMGIEEPVTPDPEPTPTGAQFKFYIEIE